MLGVTVLAALQPLCSQLQVVGTWGQAAIDCLRQNRVGAHLLHLLLHVRKLPLQLCLHVSGYSLRVLAGSSDSFSLSATAWPSSDAAHHANSKCQ